MLAWDREFEKQNGRKPIKTDRVGNRIVFLAYGAIKQVLNALESGANMRREDVLLREKRALQVSFSLFRSLSFVLSFHKPDSTLMKES